MNRQKQRKSWLGVGTLSALLPRLIAALLLSLALSACDLLPFSQPCDETAPAGAEDSCDPDPEPDPNPDPDPDPDPDPEPQLAGLTPLEFNLQAEAEGSAEEQLSFSNNGEAVLEYALIKPEETSWLELEDASGSLAPGTSAVILVSATCGSFTEPTELSTTLELKTNEAADASRFITLTLTCAALPEPDPQGAVVLTFDDNYVQSWLDAHGRFDQYDWRATFYPVGAPTFDQERFDNLLFLQNQGHEIGNHATQNEKMADPAVGFVPTETDIQAYINEYVTPQTNALEAQNITVSTFAYPGTTRTSETDAALLAEGFTSVRGGAYISTPNNTEPATASFVVNDTRLVEAFAIDASQDVTDAYIIEVLEYARDNDKIVAFFGHEIVSGADGSEALEVSLERIEKIVKFVDENNMEFLTMRDLASR